MGWEDIPPETNMWSSTITPCANCLQLQERIKSLEAENGNMDSMYQDRMLDLEARLHKHYAALRAENAELKRRIKGLRAMYWGDAE